jgi:hypothetical protein
VVAQVAVIAGGQGVGNLGRVGVDPIQGDDALLGGNADKGGGAVGADKVRLRRGHVGLFPLLGGLFPVLRASFPPLSASKSIKITRRKAKTPKITGCLETGKTLILFD